MAAITRQILLLSDSTRSMASLEGALARGQFRLHRLAPLDELEQRLPALLTSVDGAIVDGTAPYFSNGRLEQTLLLLDRHQLGAVLLTAAGEPAAPALQSNLDGSSRPDGGEKPGLPGGGSEEKRNTPYRFVSLPGSPQNPIESKTAGFDWILPPPGSPGFSPSPSCAVVPAGPRDSLPLVWPLPADQLDRLEGTLGIMAGYQQVIRQLQREIRLFQRLDHQITGHFNEIDEEMRLASRIQRDFLPKRLPSVGRAQFATLFRPAGWVSGDLYDVFRLDERRVGFYVADAVGHGMPAALLTMFIKRSMETKQVEDKGYRLMRPDETMASLNRALLEAALSASQFTTVIYAILDVESLQVEFARGGHPHPLWLHRDGSTSEPQADGALLGVMSDARFARCTIQLHPGDKLILYSDGLETVFTEDDQACSDRYRDYFEEARGLPIERMIAHLAEQMDRQIGSLNPRDDVTVVGLEIAE